MAVTSAGLLLFRTSPTGGPVQVLLVHPGGPFWRHKDAGAWSIPKGEHPAEEDPLVAARREFAEELGLAPPAGPFQGLGSVRQAGGKIVSAWAVEGDLDPSTVVSATVQVPWPPRSGSMLEVPEVDRAQWFDLDTARVRLNRGQVPLLDRLSAFLDGDHPDRAEP